MFNKVRNSSVFRAILLVVTLQLCLFKIVSTATAHEHTLADGRVIVVSHLLLRSSSENGTPEKSHHHTEFELFILQLMIGLYIAVMALFFLGLALFLLAKKQQELNRNIFSYYCVSTPGLRAPPLFN